MNKIHIFVINLKKDTAKKAQISRLLTKLNLDFEIFPAIEGKKLTSAEIDSVYFWDKSLFNRQLTNGEIGCAMSHLAIYKKMLSENIEMALIFEDDAIFDEKLIESLKIINHLPKDYELFLLGYSELPNTGKEACTINIPIKNNPTKFLVNKPIELTFCTHAYIVNKRGATKLLQQIKISLPIDWYTGDFNIMNLYVIQPKIAKVDFSFASNLATNREKACLKSERTGFAKFISDLNGKRKQKRRFRINCLLKKIKYYLKN